MKLKFWPHGSENHRPEYRWEDLRAEPTVRTAGGGVPTREEWFDSTGLNVATAGSGDIHLYSFTDESILNNEKEVRFAFQMPHAWDGTVLHPHVHWVGNLADTVAEPRWGLQYTWAGIGSHFPPTKTIYTTQHKIGLNGAEEVDVVAGRHYMSHFPDITPNTNQDGISSILLCRLFRNSSDALDTYNVASNKCGLLYFDIHYRADVRHPGSRSEYVK